MALLMGLFPVIANASKHGGGGGKVRVGATVTKSGTYVPSHTRTAPDSSKTNNWSTKGNVNPTTGAPGTKPVGHP